jgi:hypothetical protein
MERAFWIGVYLGMANVQLKYMIDQRHGFCAGDRSSRPLSWEPHGLGGAKPQDCHVLADGLC